MEGKDFLTIADLLPKEVEHLIEQANVLKNEVRPRLLEGKIIALVFEKPSLRTRVSFEVGIRQLGGAVTTLDAKDMWELYLVFSGVECFLLMLCGMSPYDAMCHTFTTMSTGGFSSHTASAITAAVGGDDSASAIACKLSVVLTKSSQSAVDSLDTSFATIELSVISEPATLTETR